MKFFFEPTLGFHYFPINTSDNGYSIPERGVAYNGPYARVGIKIYLDPIKKNFFAEPEVFYKFQHHKPSCYQNNVGDLSLEYSGGRQGTGVRILIGYAGVSGKGTFFYEPYIGFGVKYFWGTLTSYVPKSSSIAYASINPDKHDEIESTKTFNFTFPTINIGFRIGWRVF